MISFDSQFEFISYPSVHFLTKPHQNRRQHRTFLPLLYQKSHFVKTTLEIVEKCLYFLNIDVIKETSFLHHPIFQEKQLYSHLLRPPKLIFFSLPHSLSQLQPIFDAFPLGLAVNGGISKSLQFSFQLNKMAERRPWTSEEDRLLRYVFESSQTRKWSHMARRLHEQFGIRGRNGKQCRERYLTTVDSSLRKEEWSIEEEQKMIELHNKIGNKWAVIGSTIGTRNDNAVKNHFYSRLRKGLKKVNTAILVDPRLGKQFKANILYRIVEVAEGIFKTCPNFDRQFSLFSNQLKNDLFDLAYDDEVEVEGEGEMEIQLAKEMIGRLCEFTAGYKRKPKKGRKLSSNSGMDLLTPQRYHQRGKENEESDHSSIQQSSQDSNQNQNHEELSRMQHSKRVRRCSQQSSTNFLIPERIRTRAISQGNNSMPQVQAPLQATLSQKTQENPSLQSALEVLHIIQVQAILPQYPPLLLRRQSSRFSRGECSEQFHFFEDSQIEMRILPEMQYPFRRESQFEDNIFF